MKGAGKLLVAETLAFIETSPTAVSTAMVARHVKRSCSHLAAVMNLLATEHKITAAAGLDGKSHYVVLYRPYGLPLVLPEGMKFRATEERRKAERPIKGEQPKRIMVAATQIGIARHWLDRALFGDGPAHGEVVA
jgi:hypothetical protein